MNTNEMLRKTYEKTDGDYLIRHKIYCNDGFSISIQASQGHYCSPRKTFEGPYTEVELGFPNLFESLIMPYIENGNDNPCLSVYAYVPVELVDEMIEKHGGFHPKTINEVEWFSELVNGGIEDGRVED